MVAVTLGLLGLAAVMGGGFLFGRTWSPGEILGGQQQQADTNWLMIALVIGIFIIAAIILIWFLFKRRK